MNDTEKLIKIDDVLNKIKSNFSGADESIKPFLLNILTQVEFFSDPERCEESIEVLADFMMYYQSRYIVDRTLIEEARIDE